MAKKKKTKTARSRQRHRALDVLFEADEKGIATEDGLLRLLDERKSVMTAQVPIGDFGSELVDAYARNIDDIDTIIEAASKGWALGRMNALDRSLLRLGAVELMYVETPRPFVVTEYAALAKLLSTERSVGFVMGVLNRIADIRQAETGSHAESASD